MALPDGDSSVGHSFGLEFDGITIKAITEVSGLKLEQDVVEYKENGPDGKYQIRRLPGRPKAPDITLTRGSPQTTASRSGSRTAASAKCRTSARAAPSSSSTSRATR